MNELFLDESQMLQQLEEELKLERTAEEKEFFASLSSVDPYPPNQLTEEAKRKRIEKSKNDFWYFDKTYFPPELFSDYANPGFAQKALIDLTDCRDRKAHIFMGPRLIAKTSYVKRKLIYDIVFGKRKFIGFGSGTLRAPYLFMLDIFEFLNRNPRINYDYKIKFIKASSKEGLHVFTDVSESRTGTFIEPISENRSTRGGQRNIVDRYDLIIITDIENESSSLTEDSVTQRIDRINEMRTSLETWGTLLAEGNNFHPNCALNQLKKEKENGLLSENFELHIYPAWDSSRPGKSRSIWYSKYPADSEEELKKMMQPKDEYDWAGNFQQKPKPRGSDIFPQEFYQEYSTLPSDLKAVQYTDPNLSKKGKGDTTTTGALGFSPSEQKFYVCPGIICKSYSDPNELLTDTLLLRKELKNEDVHIRVMGFDGNVSQESHWTQHVRNFSRLQGIPVPAIEYKRYKVDDLTKNAEKVYKNKDVLFPPNFKTTEIGERFLSQFHGFAGKKAGKKDDAADWFICSLEMLFEMGLVRLKGSWNIDGAIKSVSKRDTRRW